MTSIDPAATSGPTHRAHRHVPRIPGWMAALAISGVIYAVLVRLILSAFPDASPHFRIDFTPLLDAGLTIQIHVAGAVTAFFVGLFLLLTPKGVGLHKPLGWTWVAAMALTAGSSFFIRGAIDGSFSPIHGLSVLTVLGLPMGVAAIRRRNVKSHAKSMTRMYLGGMAIAGLFAFLPGRLMWSLFFTVQAAGQ